MRLTKGLYEAIETGLNALDEPRDNLASTIRIKIHDHAAFTVLWSKISTVLAAYPDSKIGIGI